MFRTEPVIFLPSTKMATSLTLLALLQSKTAVDCDTLDSEVPRMFGKLVDCTSNQAIAYVELQKARHAHLLADSIARAEELTKKFDTVTKNELAVEIAMIQLSLQVAPHISGHLHTQINPHHAHDIDATVDNALRIVSLYNMLNPSFDTNRVCVKIPSTWEGLQACQILRQQSVKTLATTLFSMVQVVLAGEAGCYYIAPYVNALETQTDPTYDDPNPHSNLCVSAQRYYEQRALKTMVLAASFTSADEIMALAGIHHLTVAQALLQQLAVSSPSTSTPKSLFERDLHDMPPVPEISMNDHGRFLTSLKDTDEGERLDQAIEIFSDMQKKLEDLVQCVREGKKP